MTASLEQVRGQGPILNDDLINITDSLQTQIYVFTTPNEVCPADTVEYSVTIVPEYELIELPPAAVCPGELVNVIDYTLDLPDVEYSWTTNGGAVGSGSGQGVIESFISTNSGAETIFGQLIVQSDWYGCITNSDMDIVVDPTPMLTFPGFESPICSGEILEFEIESTVDDVFIEWTAAGSDSITGYADGAGLSIDQQLFNTGSTIESVTYTFTMPDSVCPSIPEYLEVEVVPAFEMGALPPMSACPGEVLTVDDYILPIEGLGYFWESSGGETGIPDAGTGIIPNWTAQNASGDTLVSTVTIGAELAGCESDTVFSVTVFPQAVLSASFPLDTVCSGAVFEANVQSSVAQAEIAWTAQSTNGVTGADDGDGYYLVDTLFNSGNDLGNVLYSFNNPNALCPADDYAINVTVVPAYALPAMSDITVCHGDDVVVDDYEIPVLGVTYGWTNEESIGLDNSGNGLIPSWIAENTSENPVVSEVVVTAQIWNCPGDAQSFDVTVNPQPQFDFNVGPNGGLDCQTGEAIMEIFPLLGAGTVEWNGPGLVSQQGNTAIVDAAGTYDVVLTDDATGCTVNGQVQVSEASPISIDDVIALSPPCFEGADGSIELLLNNENDVLYYWTPAVSTSNFASNLAAGDYFVTVINGSNCQDSASIQLVGEYPELVIELVEVGPTLCGSFFGFIEVEAQGGQGGFQYTWGPVDFGSVNDMLMEGEYEVLVEDAGGCEITAAYEVPCVEYIEVEVGQLITPNNDGLNDFWEITNLHVYPDHEVRVFNRWGALVYQSSPYSNDWYGTWEAGGNGEPLPSATYYFIVETNYAEGKVLRGAVEIQNEGR